MHAFSAKVVVPREAGLLHFGVRSTYILGLQIGSILSRFIAPSSSTKADRRSENKIEFFLSPRMYVNGWFFDIYIQGSKKTTLRAESEIKHRRMTMREFQLSQFGPASAGPTD